MLTQSFATTLLKGIALCSAIALLYACGGSPIESSDASPALGSSSAPAVDSSSAVSVEANSSSVASSIAPSPSSSSLGLSSSSASSVLNSSTHFSSVSSYSRVVSSSIGLSSSSASSTLSSKLSSSSKSSLTAVSSSSKSSAAATSTWQLDSANSYLNFVSAKNTHTLEVSHFASLSGDITQNVAKLVIDLNSVNSGITLRDQRLRDLLFQTTQFPTATATVNLPSNLLSSLAIGAETQQNISAELDLHGVKTTLTTKLSVHKLSATRVAVQTIAPVLVNPADYALSNGIEALRAAVGIASISATAPVDFTLIFDAR